MTKTLILNTMAHDAPMKRTPWQASCVILNDHAFATNVATLNALFNVSLTHTEWGFVFECDVSSNVTALPSDVLLAVYMVQRFVEAFEDA